MTLEELVVKIVLDATGFTSGQKAATAAASKMADDVTASATKGEKAQVDAHKRTTASAEAMSKGIVAANTRAIQSVEGTIRSFLTLFGILTGTRSLTNFVEQMIGLDATVGRLGHNVGSTSETISSIGRAVERAGGSFDGAASGIQSFSDAFQDLRTTGQSSIMEPLAKLQAMGGKPITIGKDWHKSLLQIGDDLQALDKKDPALADYLGRQVLHDPNLVNWAKRGSTAMLADEAKSPKITKEQAELAKQLQERIAALKQSFQDTGNAILMDFGPAMLSGLRWIKDLIDANRGLIETKVKEWVKEVGAWFKAHKEDIVAFGKAIGTIAAAFAGVVAAVSGQSPLAVAFEAFGAMLATSVIARLLSITTMIKAIGSLPLTGALALLVNPVTVLAAAGAAQVALAPDKPSPVLDDFTGLYGDNKNAPQPKHSPGKDMWSWIKSKIGMGETTTTDDTRVRDAIIATAKGVDDLNKAVKDGGAGVGSGGSGGGLMGGAGRALRNAAAAAGAGFRGGGSTPAKGALVANQKEAYASARAEGLSETAARALVANMSGEGLAVPHDSHWDGKHMSQGIVQWDPQRVAAIKGQFGKEPKDMSVAEQTKAAIWEINSKSRFADTAAALKGDNASAMIGALVHNYEASANQGADINKRMGYYRGFDPSKATSDTPTAAGENGKVSPVLTAMIDRTSQIMGDKLSVVSGFRTDEQNRRTGGAENSLHKKGWAADLSSEGHSKGDKAYWTRVNEAMGQAATEMGQSHRWGGSFGGAYKDDNNHFDLTSQGPSQAALDKVAAAVAARDRGPGGSPGEVARTEMAKASAPAPALTTTTRTNVRAKDATQSKLYSTSQSQGNDGAPITTVDRRDPRFAPKPTPVHQPAGENDRETRAQTPAPVPVPKPVLAPPAAIVPKSAPFPGDAGQDYRARGGSQYGVPHVESAGDAHRPEVTSTLGGTRMLPAGRMLTLDDAANHVLKTMKGANDNRPIKVDLTETGAARIGSHVGKAWTGLGHHAGIGAGERAWAAVNHARHQTTTHTVDNSSATKVGTINVHTAATDAKGIAADIEPHLARGQAAGRGNYGLA